ncbi:MAG: CPBP family intramembrane metalloprotease [Bacilli bacterium]|nr:CPBP family intramembrane metalloprotease [Bacilli bacterium]
MEAKSKKDYAHNEGYLTLVLLLVYLALEQIPWARFIAGDVPVAAITLGVRLVFAVIVFFVLWWYRAPFSSMWKVLPRAFLFAPFFLIPFSNLIGGWAEGAIMEISVPTELFVLSSFSSLLVAILEETLFRFLLMSYLSHKMKKEIALLLSSVIFGVLHLLNLFSGADVASVFLQVAYSTGIGLIAGFMWGYGGGLILPIAFHFLFNWLEGDTFRACYVGSGGTAIWVSNLVFALLAAIYGVTLFFLWRKQDGQGSEDLEVQS